MIHIYKKGDTHNFHGTKCQIQRIELIDFPRYESDGWKLTPQELEEKPKRRRKTTEE